MRALWLLMDLEGLGCPQCSWRRQIRLDSGPKAPRRADALLRPQSATHLLQELVQVALHLSAWRSSIILIFKEFKQHIRIHIEYEFPDVSQRAVGRLDRFWCKPLRRDDN